MKTGILSPENYEEQAHILFNNLKKMYLSFAGVSDFSQTTHGQRQNIFKKCIADYQSQIISVDDVSGIASTLLMEYINETSLAEHEAFTNLLREAEELSYYERAAANSNESEPLHIFASTLRNVLNFASAISQ